MSIDTIDTYTWDVGYTRQDGSEGTVIVHGQKDVVSAIFLAGIAIEDAGEDISKVAITYVRRASADSPLDPGRNPVSGA
jgi:hypothetical protein